MKKRKKKLILIILVAFLIIGLMLIIMINNYKKSIIEQGKVFGSEENEKVASSQHVMNYKNIKILNDLKGNLPVSTTTKKVTACIYTNLPTILNEVRSYGEEELKEYYNSNSSDLEEKLYIYSEESFVNLIQKAKSINCDLVEDYDSCEFEYDQNGDLTFTVKFKNGKSFKGIILGINVVNIKFAF